MLHLNFASSLDILVPRLLAEVREVWRDPFEPPTVIVPSPAVGKWLRMRLADGASGPAQGGVRPFGCVANLQMQTLERFLWKALCPAEGMELLDVAHVQQVICALLEKEQLESPIYRPLLNYLASGSGNAIDPLKRVQLSARIANRFLEYEYNRPSVWDPGLKKWRIAGIDASWLLNKNYFREPHSHEAWQRDLYCRVEACLDAENKSGKKNYITLPRLYRSRREGGEQAWASVPGPIFLFGVTKVSHFHRNTLVEISQMPGADMKVYLTNPCAEFWEDVDTSRSLRSRRRWNSSSGVDEAGITPRKPADYGMEELREVAALPRDHALLELWGGAGRENIFLWCQQAEWNFEYYSPEWAEGGPPGTLLRAVQYALLRRQDELPERECGWKDDGTLGILACPDRGREVEELREQILDLVNERKVSRLNEIAVYLPDPGIYAPYIQRVFGAFQPGDDMHIPFAILGAPAGESIIAQGLNLFLDIAEGMFDRAHVFALLRNPIIQSSRSIDPDYIPVWERWADELGIYRGYDSAHRLEMGDKGQSATDAHTFGFGAARMLIGNLAAGPADLGYELPAGQQKKETGCRLPVYPYRDFDTSDSRLLEAFCAITEDLYNDIKAFGESAGAGLHDGIEKLREIVWKWFGTISDDSSVNGAAEGRIRREFLDAVGIIKMQGEFAGREQVPLKELIALSRNCLPDEIPAMSSAWVGGITFAPLRPAMIIPHKIIFVLGLDATAFPGTSEKSDWDLLSKRRIIGDADPVRDNRFAFLEVLHAAGERLFLSYRARDMQKEEDLQPASVILELESYLVNHGLRVSGDNDRICALRRVVPWIVHESLDILREGGRAHGSWEQIEVELAGLSGGRRAVHRHDIKSVKKRADKSKKEADENLRTSLPHIRRFFANPLEYHLSKTLGIDIDEESAAMSASDEPLDSGPLALSSLQKKIWIAALSRVFPGEGKDCMCDSPSLIGESEAIASKIYDEHIASGQSPEAQFCTMEKNYILQWALRCAKTTLALKERFNNHRLLENADLSLGRVGDVEDLAINIDKKTICKIECRHRLALVPRDWGKPHAAIGIIDIKREGDAADNPDLWLAGMIQSLAEEKRKKGGQIDIIMIQLNRDDKGGPAYKTAAIKNDGGRTSDVSEWLSGFIGNMLINRCSDHLPFAAVCEIYKDDWNNITADNLNDELGGWSSYRCYLPAFGLTDARLPNVGDSELQKMARERYAPLIERWVHE